MATTTSTAKIRVLAAPVEPEPSAGPVEQYYAWDGEFGTTKNNFNDGIELRWQNPGVGDWKDSLGVEQGASAFTTFSLTRDVLNPVSFDVTAIVAGQLSAGVNRGIFLRATGSNYFSYRFAGRANAAVASRPKLVVVTSDGTFEVGARGNPDWVTTSGDRAYDRSAEFRVKQGQIHAIVQFDYAGITGTVTSATVTLTPTFVERSGVISVYEANPPAYSLGRDSSSDLSGIAAAYPMDKGIAAHPSVVFVSDFTDGAGNFDPTGWSGDVSTGKTLMLDEETGLHFLRCTLTPALQEIVGGDFSHPLVDTSDVLPYGDSHPTSVVSEMHMRYRVRVHPDYKSGLNWPPWDAVNPSLEINEVATKAPGFKIHWGYKRESLAWQNVSGNGSLLGDGRFQPCLYYSGTTPGGTGSYPTDDPRFGTPVNAFHGHMARGHVGLTSPLDPSPYAESLTWAGHYMYHIDMPGINGQWFRYGSVVMEYGRWHDIEHRMKCNTVYGAADGYGNQEANFDGVYEVWVDGKLAWSKTDFRWTRHPAYQIEAVWFGFFHGGKLFPTQTMTVDVGNVVVASEYIGPINTQELTNFTLLSTTASAPTATPDQSLVLYLHASGSPNTEFGEQWRADSSVTPAPNDYFRFAMRTVDGRVQYQPVDLYFNIDGVDTGQSSHMGWQDDINEPVYLHTERMMDSALAWIDENYPQLSAVKRTALGFSMGAWGCATYALRRPEKFAAVFASRPRVRYSETAGKVTVLDRTLGFGRQYNVASSPLIAGTTTTLAEHKDMVAYVSDTTNRIPFFAWCCGRLDGYMPFSDQVAMAQAMQASGRAFAFAWNNGNHSTGDILNSHIFNSYSHDMFELGRGWPILTNNSGDQDPAVDLEGGINLGFKWRNVTESASSWSCEISNVLGARTVTVAPFSDVYTGNATPQVVVIPAGTWVTVTFS